MYRIKSFLLMVLTLLGTTSCAHAAPKESAEVPVARREGPHPYPFWSVTTLAEAGQGAEPAADGAAFPIAPGYFLISAMSMGNAAFDMGADPHVVIKDGSLEYTGEYLAVNISDRLGLIRSDFSPPAFSISTDAGKEIAGLTEDPSAPGGYASSSASPTMCVAVPVYDGDGKPHHSFHGCRTRLDAVTGLALLDGRSRIVALLSPAGRGDLFEGVDAKCIRKFLDTYFASGGRYIQPKPHY